MDGWEFLLGDYQEDKFQAIFLPHDWAIEAPYKKEMEQGEAQGFMDRWGIGWYRKTLSLQRKKQGVIYVLSFGGVFENCTIWMNGIEVGRHNYGYSSFEVEVTEAIVEGDNLLLIKVDNSVGPVDRWYSGCGIYRTVKFLELPDNYLNKREITLTTSLHGDYADINVNVPNEGEIVVSVMQVIAGDKLREVSCSRGRNQLQLKVEDPILWSAEHPYLYRVRIQLEKDNQVYDEITIPYGLRNIEFVSGKGMLVNEQVEKLKGVCLHQEVGCRGIAAKKEIWKKRLLELKELGCNAIRTSHHTFSEEFLDLCDELGFYVYEECFDKWTGGAYGRYFATDWLQDIEAMVKRDRNRTCICIWGVGNEVENQAQSTMLTILEMLTNKTKELDPTRPVTYAMNPHFKRENNVDMSLVEDIQKFVDEVDDYEIEDNLERVSCIKRIAQYVDIISCNYQEQWYPLIHEALPDKLILGTEVYQYFCGDENQMQNYSLINPSVIPTQYEYVIGSMIWTGYDYFGESMGYPSKGWTGALLRTNGRRRPSFYMIQSYWSKTPMVHFSVMDYSLLDEGGKEHWDIPMLADHWNFPQFYRTVIPYMIFSNCERVELYLNDKKYSIPQPKECPNGVITGFLPWQPGKVNVIGYNGGMKVCNHELHTPGAAVKLQYDQSQLELHAEQGYEMLLHIKATDRNGVHCFRESSNVRFFVEGPVQIIGVDNGDLMGNEPHCHNEIHMHQGQASVLIRGTGEKGRAVISAFSSGLIAGKCVIDLK